MRPLSLWEKNFNNLVTATRHPSHDLIIYQAAQSDLYADIADFCEPLKINLEKMHEEIGGGFMEACIDADIGLAPADQAVLFKNFLRVLTMRRNQTATFMPRWSEQMDSQSSHVHLSLTDSSGNPVFWDANDPNNMSQTFKHFIGGLQHYAGDLMLIFAPTVNSARRFTMDSFAPSSLTWGIENRTTSFRVVGNSPGSIRVENRLPGADSNPYLTVAASLAAGLLGIKNQIDPAPAIVGNAFAQEHEARFHFPTDMAEAIDRFKGSSAAHEYLGPRFVETFSASRAAQVEAFKDKELIDELHRFFELG